MKKLFENIKNLSPDVNKRRALYFLFYFVFFTILLIFITFNKNNNKNVECNENDYKVLDIRNETYSFRYEITKETTFIVLTGSTKNGRTLIDKTINDVTTRYYIYYDDTYIFNEQNKWVKYDGKIIEEFDDKLINTKYINYILTESTLKHESDTRLTYVFGNDDIYIDIYFKNKQAESIKVTKGSVSTRLRYSDIDNVENIDIEIEDEEEENI